MARKRSPNSTLFIIILLVAACIFSILIPNFINFQLNRTAELFGPPAEDLNIFRRLNLSYQLLQDQDNLLIPYDSLGSEKFFTIEMGESSGLILERLKDDGLIQFEPALLNYLIYSGIDTQLQAGSYRLSAAMSAVDIANTLLDSTPQEITFVILSGWRIEEIAASLPSSGLSITGEDFLIATHTRPAEVEITQEIPFGVSLEGFFLPGEYVLDREIEIEAFFHTLLSFFQSAISFDINEGFKRQGLSLYQAVTLASIVERESILTEEQPLIASVFLNRLAIDMKLESDPTVQYAIGFDQNTWWKNPLFLEDLQFDSPYNTYLHFGLPPSPIANPSLSALQAVAFPAQTPYYYFRAACDNSGRHNFSQSFEEHIAFSCN